VVPPSESIWLLPSVLHDVAATGTHALLLHANPVAQSESTAQLGLHWLVAGLQARLPAHETGLPVHIPVPSHALSVSWDPVQVVPQLIEAPGYWHAGLTPSQVPAHIPVPHDPCRGVETLEHLPLAPVESQAWHVPPHGLSQHTPSAQTLPFPHWSSVVQALPKPSLAAQVPMTQYPVAAQSESLVQCVVQEATPPSPPPVHRNGVQSTGAVVSH
jgi:hypothetical protein